VVDYEARYQQTENARKAGELEQAAHVLRELWSQRADVRVGSRLIYCLRKLGRLHDALETATDVTSKFPYDEWSNRELAWCVYFQEVKPALEPVMDLSRYGSADGA
jgi:hypothetical protein